MAAGIIPPVSAYPADTGLVFPHIYSASSRYEDLQGYVASLGSAGSDPVWQYRIWVPAEIPTGTPKVLIDGKANAGTGNAQLRVDHAWVSRTANPFTATLTTGSVNQLSITAANQNHQLRVTLSGTPIAFGDLVLHLVGVRAGWTLAAILGVKIGLIWE